MQQRLLLPKVPVLTVMTSLPLHLLVAKPWRRRSWATTTA
jgi:hypothetical protein